MRRGFGFSSIVLVFGYLFLYVPILLLILFSFNDSRLVTVWGGWSVRWYEALFNDEQMLRAAWLSIRIAAITATIAVVLGTMAAMALVRLSRFRGRFVFTGMIAAPLVMPEVVIGLSLLLMFVAMEQAIGWPAGRGMVTIILAHSTFCAAYVTVVVQSRVGTLDQSLEEAALDLGARPLKVFFVITLPIIAPSLIAGWLLAFTLSLDDLVVSSFVSGPGATTLPMLVFSSVRLGVSPQINALATIIVVAVSIGIILATALIHRREKLRQAEERAVR